MATPLAPAFPSMLRALNEARCTYRVEHYEGPHHPGSEASEEERSAYEVAYAAWCRHPAAKVIRCNGVRLEFNSSGTLIGIGPDVSTEERG